MKKEIDSTIEILLEQREGIRAEAEEKMDAITRAIEVLQTVESPKSREAKTESIRQFKAPISADEQCSAHPTNGSSPSVIEMMREAGEALAESDEERVFTFVEVKKWCLDKWPGDEKKIRNGIYPAAKKPVEEGTWDAVEHGFKIAQRPKE